MGCVPSSESKHRKGGGKHKQERKIRSTDGVKREYGGHYCIHGRDRKTGYEYRKHVRGGTSRSSTFGGWGFDVHRVHYVVGGHVGGGDNCCGVGGGRSSGGGGISRGGFESPKVSDWACGGGGCGGSGGGGCGCGGGGVSGGGSGGGCGCGAGGGAGGCGGCGGGG